MRTFVLQENHPALDELCLVCGKKFVAGDRANLIPQPPTDPEEIDKMKAGGAYTTTAKLAHQACVSQNWWILVSVERDRFRGAAVVPGDDLDTAKLNARALGCLPEGEVIGRPMSDRVTALIPPEKRERLLTAEDCAMLVDAMKANE